MAEFAKFTFNDEKDEGHTIDKADLVAVVPDANGGSVIIHVEHDEKDVTAPPVIKRTKGFSTSDVPIPDSNRETHVILSTGSGSNQAITFFEDSVKPVLATLFPTAYNGFHIHQTQSSETILNLSRDVFFPKADAGSLLRIILLSGDGGVVDLVNGLLAKPPSESYKAPQVVLVPLGTANALYHSINAGKDNTWGLSVLAKQTARPLPTFTASFSPGARLLVDEARSEEELPKDPQTGHPILHGAVVASWGMHASLVADSDTVEYRKYGIKRFEMAAKEALYPGDGSLPHPYKAKVSFLRDGIWTSLEKEEHMYVLASMVSNLEKKFTISPASRPLDNSLHLVHFGPTDGDEAMRIMGLAYQGGKHVDDPVVKYEAIDGLRIELQGKEDDPRWRRICIDGKIVRLEKTGWVEIKKEARRVLDVAVS